MQYTVYISTVAVPRPLLDTLGLDKPLLGCLQPVPKPRKKVQSFMDILANTKVPVRPNNETHPYVNICLHLQLLCSPGIWRSKESKPWIKTRFQIQQTSCRASGLHFQPYVNQPCSTALFFAPTAPVEHGDVVAEPPPQVFAGCGRGSHANRGQRGVATIIRGTTLLTLFCLASWALHDLASCFLLLCW